MPQGQPGVAFQTGPVRGWFDENFHSFSQRNAHRTLFWISENKDKKRQEPGEKSNADESINQRNRPLARPAE
jgi:hypothetical protein